MRRRTVASLAADQAGVVSRPQLYAIAGLTRSEVRANLRAGRWQRIGSQSVAVFTGEPPEAARRWAAVFEAGPRAFLDGVSALHEAGLEKFTQPTIRVSVPRGARVRRARGVDIRQTRRWDAEDVLVAASGPRRARVEVAAIRSALWARSDKQAALLLTMVVQQGLSTPEALAKEMLRIRRDKRRRFLHDVLLDLLGGVRSLGERDVVRLCRQHGLPPPDRQVVRRTSRGTYFLDLCWVAWGVVVEVDGIQHAWAVNVVHDALRHNEVTLQDSVVLRLPLLGLRVAPDDFFEQIRAALVARGWQPPGRHTLRAQ